MKISIELDREVYRFLSDAAYIAHIGVGDIIETLVLKSLNETIEIKNPKDIAKEYGIEQENKMGMSIDNANKLLSVITSTITEDDDCFTIEDENLQVFKETLLTAIDTMRKYQKIAELYDYWRSGKCEYTISCMENIGKVLKDGKID